MLIPKQPSCVPRVLLAENFLPLMNRILLKILRSSLLTLYHFGPLACIENLLSLKGNAEPR
jgi:hypothetical protein